MFLDCSLDGIEARGKESSIVIMITDFLISNSDVWGAMIFIAIDAKVFISNLIIKLDELSKKLN